jgi:hypothetical protein
MKYYLSSPTADLLIELEKIYPNRKINILKSFGVQNKDDHKFNNNLISNIASQMYDCGAFTVNNADKYNAQQITLYNYIQHLNKYKASYEYYSNFDSDFTSNGFNKNLKSLRRIEEAGLNPFPVIHDYFVKEVKYYIDNGYEFIALGGVRVPGQKKQYRSNDHIKAAFKRIPIDKVKVHLFGASSFNTIIKWPLYSCDSSSWAQNNKYGFVLYWNLNKSGLNKTEKLFFLDKNSDYKRKDRQYWEKVPFKKDLEYFISELGITYTNLMGHRAFHYRQLLNTIYYLTIEDVITQYRLTH